jgi:hypothetical protein
MIGVINASAFHARSRNVQLPLAISVGRDPRIQTLCSPRCITASAKLEGQERAQLERCGTYLCKYELTWVSRRKCVTDGPSHGSAVQYRRRVSAQQERRTLVTWKSTTSKTVSMCVRSILKK